MLAGELLNSLIRRESNQVTRETKKEKAGETSVNLDQRKRSPSQGPEGRFTMDSTN
jgi:hypothetical protein